MKYCPHCGQLIKSDAMVCPYCGYHQSRVVQDRQLNLQDSEPDQQPQFTPDARSQNNRPSRIAFSKAKLSGMDVVTLIVNALNAGTLFFLGFQGLLRPFYINNTGTFVTIVLSLAGLITTCMEIHQNRQNRLPIWSALMALIGNLSVFVMVFMFNQQILLISLVILVIALLLFDWELKRTY